MRELLTKKMTEIIDDLSPEITGGAALRLVDHLEEMINLAEANIITVVNPEPAAVVEVAAVRTIATMLDTQLEPIRACLDDLVAVGIAGGRTR